jgi:hypothetical protein
VRTLPLDKNTLEMLSDYIKRGELVNRKGKKLIFGIKRHHATQDLTTVPRYGLVPILETGIGLSPLELEHLLHLVARL